MKRNIYKALLSWKNEPKRKPILLRGARQVGKSYVVDQFGKNEFQDRITINFERNPEYKEIFSSFNPQEIIERITLFTGKKIIAGNTLIFLDEIQDCPSAILSLRYFYEEFPELHIIGAGSLLEFSLQSEEYRMPVGRIQYLYMYPLSFSEFMNAINETVLNEHISNFENLKDLAQGLHNKLIDLVRKYFIIGGMPAVVQEYIRTGDILKCQKIQHSIIETYQDDFSKYARKSQYKYVGKVFRSIPSMVGQKLVYTNIDKAIKSRDLKAAFELLETAGIIYKVKSTNATGLPFEANVKEGFYKPLFLDIGLLHAVNGIYSETIRETDLIDIYKGAVAEQFVGQELLAIDNYYTKAKLYYWVRDKKNSSAEVDYLISKDDKIIPIEVKSGRKGKLKSLNLFLEIFSKKYGVKISQSQYKSEEGLLSIPLYGIKAFLNHNG